ncbi:hypothetical protein HYW17_02495 [Candidatus Uhrbacteria bacterium]|nr:hypothetical protein [Candidatus Uhrbacteria bacterium]
MVNEERIRELAKAMSRKLAGGMDYGEAQKQVFHGLRGDERAEYLSAVGSRLSMSGHLQRARELPNVPPPPKDTPATTATEQLGFGFGEGPRRKIRPPTRRHL